MRQSHDADSEQRDCRTTFAMTGLISLNQEPLAFYKKQFNHHDA